MAKQKIEIVQSDKPMRIRKEDIINALVSKLEESKEDKEINLEEYTKLLLETLTSYNKSYEFKVGELVVWKEGLKNKRVPKYGRPAVVLEIFEKPIIDEDAPLASRYYREKLDIKLAFLDSENELVTFHYDSCRFKPFE